MGNLKKLVFFLVLAIAAVSVWVVAYKAIFPIEPALYSISGFLSL